MIGMNSKRLPRAQAQAWVGPRRAPRARRGLRGGPVGRRGTGAVRQPNDRWSWALARCRSNSSGRAKTSGSRFAAPMHTRTSAPAGSSTPVSVTAGLRAAPPVDDGRVVPQHLLHGTRDRGRVGDDLRPSCAVLQQPAQRVAEQVGRRLVSGEQQPEEDRRHLLLGERQAVVVRGVHEVGGEVRTRRGAAIVRPAPRSSARRRPSPWRCRPARPRRRGRT